MNNRIKIVLGGLVMALMATAVYLLLPGEPGLNHVAYGAAMVGVAVMVVSALILVRNVATIPQDAVFPITAWGYLISNLLLSALVLGLEAASVWIAPWPLLCLAHTLLLGGFTLRLLALAAGKEHIDRVGETVALKVTDWRMLLADLEGLKDRVPAGLSGREKVVQELQALYEAFRYSDPMSTPPTAALDAALKTGVAALAGLVPTAGTEEIATACGNLLSRLKDRNTRVKALK